MVYIVPKPNEAILISGGLSGDKFRVVTGKGAFFIPFFQQVHKFYLVEQECSRFYKSEVNCDIH